MTDGRDPGTSLPTTAFKTAARWRRPLQLLLAVLFAATSAWHVYDISAPGPLDRVGRLVAPDFLQFYTYGTLVRTDRSQDLYDSEAHQAIAQTIEPRVRLGGFLPNYSPVVAWAMAPLSGLTYRTSLVGFTIVMAGVYVGAVVWLLRQLPYLRREVLTVALAAAAWPAIFTVIRYGQISPMSMAILTTATVAAARGHMSVAGLALGLLVYKPNLLLVPALVFVAARQWRLLAGMMAGAALETTVNVALAGPDAALQYAAILWNLGRHPELVQFFPAESHSIRGFVGLLLPWPPVVTAVTMLAIPVAAWLAARVWSAHTDWRPRWAAVVLASLLGSPHLLTYDLLLLAVPLMLVGDWVLERTGKVPAPYRWTLVALYFSAWPGVFIARVFHVQVSTLAMGVLLSTLSRAPRTGPA
jgi:hypothetical protein